MPDKEEEKKPVKKGLTAEEKAARFKNITTIFELMQNLDCVFCIDTTGSMDDYIPEVKKTIAAIIEKIKKTEV